MESIGHVSKLQRANARETRCMYVATGVHARPRVAPTAPHVLQHPAVTATWHVGARYGAALLGCLLTQFVFNEQMFFLGERLALQCRGAIVCLLYRKALTLSCASRASLGHGEVLTRTLVAENDRDFLARRTLVQWLYNTQPALLLR